MTDKTKMSNLESYTELSIQIATLDMKLDAILKLINKSEITTNHPLLHRQFVEDIITNPVKWPNESHTDYLKRIGQYNEAQSDDEYYGEVYK